MNRIFFSFAAAAAASLATFGAVGPADANTGGPASVAVSHADLNLSQAQDRRILDQRIANAARRACRTEIGHSALANVSIRDCSEEAVARAAEQIPLPDGATD